MIKRIRNRFILIVMLSMTIALMLIGAIINIVQDTNSIQRIDGISKMLSENGGDFPKRPIGNGMRENKEMPFETRYFTVIIDENGVMTTDVSHIAAIDETGAEQFAEDIIASGSESGFKDDFRYNVYYKADSTEIVAVNFFMQQQEIMNLLFTTLFAIACCDAFVLALLFIFSRRMTRSLTESYEKQRRFITDAGHELKTPLTIISANTDVIEMTNGESEWTQSIKEQSERMNLLIKQLIDLSRLDEDRTDIVRENFSMSETVEASAEAFRTIAELNGKKLECDIESGITYMGIHDEIIRLVGILLDNAIKYCDENGTINVKLVQKHQKILLSVSNPCIGLDKNSISKLFDRFYRADTSRSRKTGGYGIGLSIAQSIVIRSKGKIYAEYNDDIITFKAEF